MKLSKPMKKFILTMLVIFILALSGYTYVVFKTPRYENQSIVHYSYSSHGSINYRVYLKPNIVYSQKYLEQGRYYIFKYIDHIEAECKYTYNGSATADLRTAYSVVATLQGLHGSENEVLWSKTFDLLPAKSEQGKSAGKVISKTLSVPLDSYGTLAEALFLNSEVNSPVILNITFNVHTRAFTDSGVLDDALSPGLQVPINENVFKISGKPDLTGGNKIAETVRILLPLDLRMIIMLSSVIFVLFIFLIIAACAKVKQPPDPFRKKIDAVFKEYGERLAGMDQTISYMLAEIITVNSIEDLVKIADEVGQPVFYYKVDSRTERKIEFYVFDNNRTYYMVIFGEITATEEETSFNST